MLVDAKFATHDRDEAQELVQRVYPGSAFRECVAPFTYKQRVVGDSDAVSIARFAARDGDGGPHLEDGEVP